MGNHREGSSVKQRVIANLGHADELTASEKLDDLARSTLKIRLQSGSSTLTARGQLGREAQNHSALHSYSSDYGSNSGYPRSSRKFVVKIAIAFPSRGQYSSRFCTASSRREAIEQQKSGNPISLLTASTVSSSTTCIGAWPGSEDGLFR